MIRYTFFTYMIYQRCYAFFVLLEVCVFQFQHCTLSSRESLHWSFRLSHFGRASPTFLQYELLAIYLASFCPC